MTELWIAFPAFVAGLLFGKWLETRYWTTHAMSELNYIRICRRGRLWRVMPDGDAP